MMTQEQFKNHRRIILSFARDNYMVNAGRILDLLNDALEQEKDENEKHIIKGLIEYASDVFAVEPGFARVILFTYIARYRKDVTL